jgi:hypothetical protein
MKMKMSKQFNDVSELMTMQLSLHLDKKNECFEHNHIIEYVNIIKINFEVKSTVSIEIFKNYTLVVVNRNLQKIKWTINKLALNEMRDRNLTLKDELCL